MREQINKVELLGSIGKVIENRVGDSKMYQFSVCTNRVYNSNGAIIVQNTWHSVRAMDNIIKGILIAGKECHVFGQIENLRYVANDNTEKMSVIIAATSVEVFND